MTQSLQRWGRFYTADGTQIGTAVLTANTNGMPLTPAWISPDYLENVKLFSIHRSGQVASNVSASGIKVNGKLLTEKWTISRDESNNNNSRSELRCW